MRHGDNSVTIVLNRYARVHQSWCRQSRRGRLHCPRTRTCRAWRKWRRSLRGSAQSALPICKMAQRLLGASSNVGQL